MLFKQEIAKTVAKQLGLQQEDIIEMIEIPPQQQLGDYALPCFQFASTQKRAPQQIAAELAENITLDFISKIDVKGPYLNFFLDRKVFAKSVLENIQKEKENYGKNNQGNNRAVCIDFSSINIAKPFHIGHLSSTAIGHALYNIYNFCGYKSVGINHLGDWGTQFGKLIVAYKTWGDTSKKEEISVKDLSTLYVKFHEEAEKDPSLDDDARAWFKKIEEQDAEAMQLFDLFKKITLDEVAHTYELLGITFDSYAGESFYNDKMDAVIEELKEKNLLTESDGAYVVDLEKYNMPPCIILKSDGTTLYSTRDIAAALYRKKTYDFAKSLYVVAYQQNLHFKQLFQVIELMGYPWANDMEHVAFGMVSLEGGQTLSTRKGQVVLLEDVLHRSIERAKDIMEERNPEGEMDEDIAVQVGVGAVVFGVLYNSRIKDITFSYERALSFEGETSPYLQYTHARCNSLLERASFDQNKADFSILEDEFAWPVLTLCGSFPAVIIEAMEKNEPYLLSRHLMDLAQRYNRYYFERRIIENDDESGTNARLMLTSAVKTILKTGLKLLGIAAPDKM